MVSQGAQTNGIQSGRQYAKSMSEVYEPYANISRSNAENIDVIDELFVIS